MLLYAWQDVTQGHFNLGRQRVHPEPFELALGILTPHTHTHTPTLLVQCQRYCHRFLFYWDWVPLNNNMTETQPSCDLSEDKDRMES